MTKSKKPSPAAKARAALDPDPPSPSSSAPLQQQRERSVIEEARPPPVPEPVRLLSAKEVMNKIGVSWPTLFNWSKCGKFPPPRQVSSKKIMWLSTDVDAWIANLPVRQLPLKGGNETDEA